MLLFRQRKNNIQFNMIEVSQISLVHNEEGSQGNRCRACQTETSELLINPCNCDGSIKYIHGSCFNKWFQRRLKLYPQKFERSGNLSRTQCEFCLSMMNFKIQNKLVCQDKKTLILLILFQIFWNYEFFELAEKRFQKILHEKSLFLYLFWYIVVFANLFGVIYLRYKVKVQKTAFYDRTISFTGEKKEEYCKSCLKNNEKELLKVCHCQNKKFHKQCFTQQVKMFCEEYQTKKDLRYVICRFCSQKTQFQKEYEFNMDKDNVRIGGLFLALFLWDLLFMILNLKIIQSGFIEELRSMLFFTYLNFCIGSIIFRKFKKKKIKRLIFKEGTFIRA